VREELARTAALIGDAKYFRPPRGVMTGVAAKAAAHHGYDVLLWSCATASLTTTEAVGAHLTSHVRPGPIERKHDGLGRAGFSRWAVTARNMRARRAMELAALPGVLTRAADRGVRFVTVTDLVGPGITPVM
jgi:peptidoglycan/xylan/chitin deacetylase (PgdA/CDA1 family)